MQNRTFRPVRFFSRSHCLWLLLCLQFSAFASPLVENINNFEDYAIKHVNALAQDQDGLLWIATPNGLFRYDGDSVKRFAHQVDEPNSLAGNWVVDVVAGKQGYLWVISRGQGLSRFDTQAETFVHFYHRPADVTTLDSNELNSVALTPNNQLWIASNSGLNLFNTQTLTNQRFDTPLRFDNERQALAGAIGQSYWSTGTAYALYALLGSLSLAFYYLKRVRVYRHQKIITQVENVNNNIEEKANINSNLNPSLNSCPLSTSGNIEGQSIDLVVVEKMKARQLKQKFILLLNKVLEKNYHDCHFDVTRFAGGMLISKRQLNRKTHSMVDMSPAEAIRHFRLNKAAEQLIKGAIPSCVCYEVGFTSHSYFSSCFKTKYHCLPCNYMAIILETGNSDETQP